MSWQMINKYILAALNKIIRNETSLREILTMDTMELNFNNTDDTYDELYVMPLHIQLIWFILFLVIVLVGTVGNLTVIWIVLAHRSTRTVLNLFIVNLALADAASSLFNAPVTSLSEIFINWIYGGFFCKFNSGLASVSVFVSVITLAALSIERYNVILTPFKPRMRRRTAIIIILVIWSVGLVITIPHWYFVEIEYLVHNDEEITLCLLVWYKMSYGELLWSFYSIIFMVITYFLPLACMSFTYGRVAMRLWGAEAIGEETELHLKQKQAKQKVVKMMIVVVIVFAICWMPMHLYFIFMTTKLTTSPIVNNFYLALFWLAMSNSMYNPIIYCWMNDKFRDGFKEAYRCCLCICNGSNCDETITKL